MIAMIQVTDFVQKPKGLLMTPFVIRLAKLLLKYMNCLLTDYGHPCGLIAFILTAVSLSYLAPFFPFDNAHSSNVPFRLLKRLENIGILVHSFLATRLFLQSIL